ncbi:HPr family phosphocarrier protein [Sporosarcina gallistercoris]|uniref:HPr family phosphocarrier protein n=1 Tax=Sporosarcina gallistercoris TaxID=2762245 RepID=A0ABR8PLA1_9BACL|nr:HPr family phosphocarrier protein [Sporosarcina gallistercoris]MBD7908924.1 HPr family phosphocarrier protein [Sporosarcina gallistercoris]
MIEKTAEVKIKPGLQARQAALFVQEANRYTSDLYVKRDERQVNAKSIMGVMSLAIAQGSTVTLIADGGDEEQAAEALVAFVQGLN